MYSCWKLLGINTLLPLVKCIYSNQDVLLIEFITFVVIMFCLIRVLFVTNISTAATAVFSAVRHLGSGLR